MRIGESYRPLREIVAEEIRAMIVNGDLKPGERIVENKLAEELAVSRNPVREAIRSLEVTGLVEVIPRKGAYVSQLDIDDVRQLLDLRCVLEGYAAEIAAGTHQPEDIERLTQCIDAGAAASKAGDHVRAAEMHRDFHLAIERASGNPYLEIAVGPLRHRTEMVFSMLADTRGLLAWKEHERIRDAIAASDPDGAREAIVAHIQSVMSDVLRTAAARGATPAGGDAG